MKISQFHFVLCFQSFHVTLCPQQILNYHNAVFPLCFQQTEGWWLIRLIVKPPLNVDKCRQLKPKISKKPKIQTVRRATSLHISLFPLNSHLILHNFQPPSHVLFKDCSGSFCLSINSCFD